MCTQYKISPETTHIVRGHNPIPPGKHCQGKMSGDSEPRQPRVFVTWLPKDLSEPIQAEEAQRFSLVANGMCDEVDRDCSSAGVHIVIKHLPLLNR